MQIDARQTRWIVLWLKDTFVRIQPTQRLRVSSR